MTLVGSLFCGHHWLRIVWHRHLGLASGAGCSRCSPHVAATTCGLHLDYISKYETCRGASRSLKRKHKVIMRHINTKHSTLWDLSRRKPENRLHYMCTTRVLQQVDYMCTPSKVTVYRRAIATYRSLSLSNRIGYDTREGQSGAIGDRRTIAEEFPQSYPIRYDYRSSPP